LTLTAQVNCRWPGSESLFLFPVLALPLDPSGSLMGTAYSQWFASGGTTGTKPEDPDLFYQLSKPMTHRGSILVP
jgi:hypothetical protein